MWKETIPYHKVSGGTYDYFNDMGMPDLLKCVEKVDDHTVKFTLNKPEAPFIADLAMDFAVDPSPPEYADAMLKAGTPEKSTRIRSAPARSSSSTTRRTRSIRYKAYPGLLARQAEDRRPGLRDHPGRRRSARPSWRRANATSCRIRTRPTSRS